MAERVANARTTAAAASARAPVVANAPKAVDEAGRNAPDMLLAGPVTVAQLLALQRTAGNQAVATALARRAADGEARAAASPTPADLVVQRSACCDSCADGGPCKDSADEVEDHDRDQAPAAAPGPSVQTLREPSRTAPAVTAGARPVPFSAPRGPIVPRAGPALVDLSLRTITPPAGQPLVQPVVQRGLLGTIGSAIAGGARSVGSAIVSGARAVGSAVAGGASAVAGAASNLVPDWIRNLFSRGPSQAEGGLAEANAGSARAHAEAERADSRARSTTQAAAAQQQQRTSTEVERLGGATERQASTTQARSGQIADAAAAGLRALRSTAPLLAPTLVPGVVIANPEQVARAAQRVTGAAVEVGGRAAGQIQDGIGGLRDDIAAFRWTCDTAEVTALAGRVSRRVVATAVGVGDTLTGGRVSQIIGFAGQMGSKVAKAASALGRRVRGVASAIRTEIGRRLEPVANAARTIGSAVADRARRIAATVADGARVLRDRAVAGLERVGTAIRSGVQALGRRISDRIASVVSGFQRAFQVAGAIINRVFPGARGILDRIVGMVNRARERVAEGIAAARTRIAQARTWIATHARQAGDRALQAVARLRQRVRERMTRLREFVSRHRRSIIAAIPGAPLIAAGVVAARAAAARLRTAAQAVARRASGAVCTAANAVGGPCVNQYLPNPGPGNAATLTGAMAADVTIPLHEVGVPCSARIAQGGSVAVKREGDDFTVTLTGQGSVTAVENLEASASGTASIDLPAGGKAQVWNQLGGRSSAPPALAAAAGTAGATGLAQAGQAAAGGSAGGGGLRQVGSQAAEGAAAGGTAGAASPGAKFEAGVRGTLVTEYKFNARGSNCNGVGGMLGLLSALGVAGSLPAPLNHLATAATHASFTDQLQKVQFTAAAQGRASVDLLSGSAGTIQGALTGEVSTAAVHRRATDADRQARPGAVVDGFVDEMVVRAALTGEAGFELPGVGGISGIGASTSAAGEVSLTLVWNHAADVISPEKAEGKLTLEVGLTGVDLGALARLLPADASPALARLRAMLARPLPSSAKLAFEATAAIENLDVLGGELDRYFSTPEAVTVDGALAIVRRHLATGVTRGVKLTLTQTSRVAGAALGGQGTFEGITLGANASASVDASLEQQLYPAA